MKLLTKELEARFKEVGSQEREKDPLVIAKFFNPCGAGTWFATEWDEKNQEFFGYVSIFGDHRDEWGRFSLRKLETLELPFGLHIERDILFQEKRISEVCPKAIL